MANNIKEAIKKSVDVALKGTKKVRQGSKIVNASELLLTEREVLFRQELEELMKKYHIGLSVATVDTKTVTLPPVEA